jgi:hypothetical protein
MIAHRIRRRATSADDGYPCATGKLKNFNALPPIFGNGASRAMEVRGR